MSGPDKINRLKIKRLGIDTRYENIIFMRQDSHLGKSEGFEALTRVRVSNGALSLVATINVVRSELITNDEISLSEGCMRELNLNDGDEVEITHLSPIDSLGLVRAKIYGKELSYENYSAIMNDIVKGNYSTVHISGFVTACASHEIKLNEIVSLTKSMIDVGETIKWNTPLIMDKHCIGGIPANRTTPIVVSILAAYGLMIPKTSSRAITSPAGTADMMDVITNTDLDINQIKDVVNKENGCLAWGGSVKLSPADDILIRVERSLDLDSEAQMIASVLSKKKSAGATHVLIDIPFGATAKVRCEEDAVHLKELFEKTGEAIGLKLKVLITNGEQPIGNGIGPELEAMDVLSVLKNEPGAPQDLKNKSIILASTLLELSGKVMHQDSEKIATEILLSGKAFQKFKAICNAQGRYTEPTVYAPYKIDIKAEHTGIISEIDNRKLAKIAKLAGAPNDPCAGVYLYQHIDSIIEKGQKLYSVYAKSSGQLNYALEYANQQHQIIKIQGYGESID